MAASNLQPAEKIFKLQILMQKRGLDAYLVPSSDPHQSEYVAEHWQARAWLSGFQGSAGTLVVTQTKAGLWTDPRYHIRAVKELEGSNITLFKSGLPDVPTYQAWLEHELPDGASIGFDGEVVSVAEVAAIKKSLEHKSIRLVHHLDLVEKLWHDRPALPKTTVFLYPEQFAGESRTAKIQRIRNNLQSLAAQAHLITALDDIAWTLNIRANDVAFNPVSLAYLLITEPVVQLFIHQEKVPPALKSALEQDGVLLTNYDDIFDYLQTIKQTSILIDPDKTSYQLEASIARDCNLNYGSSIPTKFKAIKNTIELGGLRQAQLRDGVALVRWLVWLEHAISESQHTEISVAEKLTELRSLGEHYQGLSFGTIVGYQANSAVGHYKSDPKTTPALKPEGILLVDSGGQYLDGTTDITRTVSLGNPTAEEKKVFTTVLKALIKLSTTIFPDGTRGSQLDAVARAPLWQEGWDCRHGIGHGVGHFLNVHEGPQRFSKSNEVAFEAGMLTSCEPGVYFEGKFGVRLENLLVTVEKEATDFGKFYTFETVTFAPFDLNLLEPSLLNKLELVWLNDYHDRVYENLSRFLIPAEKVWLKDKTRRMSH